MKNTQLNALGAFEDLELFDKKGNIVYKFLTNSKGDWWKYTYNEKGNPLTCENSKGDWSKYTYDEKGNILTFKNRITNAHHFCGTSKRRIKNK